MQLRTRTWLVISLLCFVLAGVFWQMARRKEAERDRLLAERVAATNVPTASPAPRPAVISTNAVRVANTNSALLPSGTNNLQVRVSNTDKPLEELLSSEQAILLGNAWIDSSAPLNLAIPAHLRAQGDPGSYIVQSRGPTSDTFRQRLTDTGAQIISYLPNNAWLVRATTDIAERLRQFPGTQAVLPWEPFYKLEPELLALAVEQKPMPGARPLNLLLFPGELEVMEAALRRIGVAVGTSERSPFGVQLAVHAPAESLVAIAQLTGVQAMERRFERQAANDLTRARVRVSTNTITPNQYQSLTGSGVVVNVNDFGVGPHPDLPMVSGATNALIDLSGHGTHVAGIIASTGNNGPPGQNVRGSVSNANFRGMAPAAAIFSQTIDPIFAPLVSDTELQLNAALTNALISNNSWTYPGDFRYSMASVLWDEAARDAVPGMTGSQPLTLVFAAGNASGFNNFTRVSSPGTAKNVLTVGAVENRRLITNVVTTVIDGVTNTSQPWLGITDSSNQVANFSARGNVGVGDEGIYGRFKPDVVAPGTFVVSTRPTGYAGPSNSTGLAIYEYPDQIIPRGLSNLFSITVPPEGTTLYIQVLSNRFSPKPFPSMPIYAVNGAVPGVADLKGVNFVQFPVTPGTWNFSVGNPTNIDVGCDVRALLITTNESGNYFEQLALLNAPLGSYGFETGTSQAAPVVSGLLALIAQRAGQFGRTNSPALMKAMMINGARSLGTLDYQVRGFANQQGWGIVNITNSLPLNGANPIVSGAGNGPMVFAEQNPARALVTGQSHEFLVNVASGAPRTQPVRVTLVWTDPPGNPAASVKLVNNLDLVVIDNTTGAVYPGNNFPPGNLFTSTSATNSAGELIDSDSVNNVENVFLPGAGSGSFTVRVIARRVNVNAVAAQTAGVAQDYALVISSGHPSAAAVSVTEQVAPFNPSPSVVMLTNGLPLLDQRVGANSALLVSTNGVTNQWRFFAVDNTLTNGVASNIAFAVFLPPNLSRSRTNGADLDLFVSTNPDLTNLSPAVIATSLRGVGRAGSEAVIIPNATPGILYYAGVKSEDQQAGEFGIFAVSSEKPFSSTDDKGNIVAQGYPLPTDIPDGDSTSPQAALVFAFVLNDVVVQNVVVSNIVTHGSLGDLQGVLQHDGKFSILNNNDSDPISGSVTWLFDDSDSGKLPTSRTTSAPGTLRNFAGEQSQGLWQLYEIDSTFSFTGRVDEFTIYIQPREQTNIGDFTFGTILPGRWEYIPIDVPVDATNLFACVAPQNGVVEVYIRRGAFPSTNTFDLRAVVLPPGDCVNLTRRDAPPLSPGRYIIGYYNPNPTTLEYYHREGVERDLRRSGTLAYRSQEAVALLDDAVTNSTIFVNDNRLVADARVGVRIDHPRVSDLVLHLVNPSGTRILLSENRGNISGDGYGFGTQQSNSVTVPAQGFSTPVTNIISGGSYEGTLQVTYDFFNAPDRMTVYYDGQQIFDSGLVNGSGTFSVDYGPGASTNLEIIVNEVLGSATTFWTFSAVLLSGYNYFTFTDDTNFTTAPVKFALPPFTNFNYVVTNSTTNGFVVDDGFEVTQGNIPVPAGSSFSGWTVDSGDIEVLGPLGPPWNTLPDSGFFYIDLNGAQPGSISTNFPTVPGYRYNVSFAYTRNAINPGAPTADVLVDGMTAFSVSAPVSTNTGFWLRTNFTLYASGTNTSLAFISTTPISADAAINASGVFLDSILVEEVAEQVTRGIYYQPEEPLTPLKGEPAFGDWKLEIWDNRLGGAVTNGALLAWRLNLAFVNTNPPVIPLNHGVTNCLTLASNETAYFVVNVPFSALSASNYITASGGVDLIYDGFGVPEITEPPSTFFLTNVTTGLTVISTNGWNSFDAINNGMLIGGASRPVIRPGRRYYLAVRNREPTTNDFCITVWFDRLDPDLTTIVPITNICTSGAVTSTNEYDYFSVDIAPNALQVQVTLDSFSSDLDLYLTTGLPLPLNTFFFRSSTNVGLVPEWIDVVDFCDMVPSNRWYIAVRNPTPAAGIPFQLCVYQTLGTVRDLQAGGVVSNQVAGSGIDYYRINLLSNACLASFALSSDSTNLGLYAAPMELLPVNMAPTNTPFLSTNALSTNQFIQVTGGSLTQGCWIIAVVNPDAVPVPYLLSATQDTNCADNFVRLTNDMALCTNAMPGQVDFYKFQPSPDALQVVFETFSTNGDVDLYATYNNPTPFPGPTNFLFASTNLGFTNEFICAARPPLASVNRTWYLAVTNKSAADASYCIRAVELRQTKVTVLTNGRALCVTNLPPPTNDVWNSGVHFYSLAVTGKTFEAIIELYSLTGNADLYVQRGLCVTNFTTFDVTNSWSYFGYASTNLSTNREYLCVATNSMPVPLTNGLWYIAVVNRETNATNYAYCLKATLHDTNVMTHFASAGSILCTNVGPTNLSVLDGVNYHVLRVSNNVLAVSFETISMSGDVDLYVQRAPCLVNFASLAGPPTNYPYASTNAGLLKEWVCVASNSAPVPLEPGDWFIAVVNRSSPTTNVNYCLRATPVMTSQITNIAGTTNELFEGKDICRTLGTTNDTNTALGVHYYVIEVPTNGALMELETLNATGNVDLFLQYGSPCFPLFSFNAVVSNSIYSSTSLGTNNEIICVTTNTRPFPLTNGLWYAAVVNRTAASVDYCLRTRLLLTNDIYHLSNGLARCSSMTKTGSDPRGEVNYYVFRVSSNAVQATFETFGANGNVDLYVQYGPCLTNYPNFRGAMTNYPYLSTNIFTNTSLHFYPYASTNRGRTNETICLVTNSLQVPLLAGDWYIAVVNRSTNGSPPVDYCVRAVEVLSTQITELSHNVPRYMSGLVPLDTDVVNIGVDYYHYRVTNSAIQLSVELFSNPTNGRNLDLYVKKHLCWIDPTNFTYASTHPSNHSEHVFVATNSMPVRLTEGDWYFAVVNRDTNFTADYTIRALEFLDRDILPLANCVLTQTNVVGTNLSYVFQGRDFFVFEVSTDAVQVLFEMVYKTNASRFYVSRELPLPLVETNDYASLDLTATNHWVMVGSNSTPTALAPGLWFMTVENHGLDTNIFVRASEIVTTNIARLDNSSSQLGVLPPEIGYPNKPPINYHVFRVSSNAVQANFRLYGMSGMGAANADLFISQQPLPSPTNFQYFSTNSGLNDESITLITNGLASPLQPGTLLPGDWYVAVVNREKFPVSYTVCVAEYSVGFSPATDIVRLTNGLAFATNLAASSPFDCGSNHHYLYTVSTNPVQLDIELLGPTGNVDLYVRRFLPLPTDAAFEAGSATGGANPELIRLTAGTSPPLAPGDYFITVVNHDVASVDYAVRVVEYALTNAASGTRVGAITNSGDCIQSAFANTNDPANPFIHYYKYTVSTNALRVQFELGGLTNDFNLIVSHGLPLPTLTNYSAFSTNQGNCDELITFTSGVTNALGATFETGDWYIGVVNTNSASGSYRLCVREFDTTGLNPGIALSVFSNQLCLTVSPTLPGASYYVVGKQNLGETNWTLLSFTLLANDTNLTWCTSLPTPYMFFDVLQGLAPKDQLPQIQFQLTFGGGNFVLCWSAPTNLQFVVEWSDDLITWTPFSSVVTSSTGTFKFTDDGVEFPLGPFRFYRIILLP
jgi:subtilisin-like proprotein convertase family protein